MIKHLPVILAVGLSAVWTSGASVASATVAAAPAAPAATPSTAPAAAAPLGPAVPPATTSAPSAASSTTMWQGEVRRAANVRREPNTRAAVVREVTPGTPVSVQRWVAGELIEPDNPTWAQIAPGEYIYAMSLRPLALPTPVTRPDMAGAGKWIDVDVTRQVATAYEGATPVHSTFASTGRPDWETPLGTWRIQRRVADETMDGASLAGQGPDGKGATYHVEHVRYTQYFTSDGSAIHENSWRDPATFGIPGSHGCVGLVPTEAAWFWTWATTGTQVVVHA